MAISIYPKNFATSSLFILTDQSNFNYKLTINYKLFSQQFSPSLVYIYITNSEKMFLLERYKFPRISFYPHKCNFSTIDHRITVKIRSEFAFPIKRRLSGETIGKGANYYAQVSHRAVVHNTNLRGNLSECGGKVRDLERCARPVTS